MAANRRNITILLETHERLTRLASLTGRPISILIAAFAEN